MASTTMRSPKSGATARSAALPNGTATMMMCAGAASSSGCTTCAPGATTPTEQVERGLPRGAGDEHSYDRMPRAAGRARCPPSPLRRSRSPAVPSQSRLHAPTFVVHRHLRQRSDATGAFPAAARWRMPHAVGIAERRRGHSRWRAAGGNSLGLSGVRAHGCERIETRGRGRTMTERYEFGLDTFGDVTVGADGAPLSHAQTLRNVVEEAELADRLGLDFFGVGEHHRHEFAVSAPEVVLARDRGPHRAHPPRLGGHGAELRRPRARVPALLDARRDSRTVAPRSSSVAARSSSRSRSSASSSTSTRSSSRRSSTCSRRCCRRSR